MKPFLTVLVAGLFLSCCSGIKTRQVTLLRPESVMELNDNGAWSWFMDERVIVDHAGGRDAT